MRMSGRALESVGSSSLPVLRAVCRASAGVTMSFNVEFMAFTSGRSDDQDDAPLFIIFPSTSAVHRPSHIEPHQFGRYVERRNRPS